MTTLYCDSKCCKFHITPYIAKKTVRNRENRRKAGVFVHDPDGRKVLLVQSRGRMWGPPKGTAEVNETYEECGKRELMEETGLRVPDSVFASPVHIKSNVVYYEARMRSTDCQVQGTSGNDANGIGWFDIDCLQRSIAAGRIIVNQHYRLTASHFL
jgi:8-oxo-dGTP pyrophosphatase MutT (NUDIX family)